MNKVVEFGEYVLFIEALGQEIVVGLSDGSVRTLGSTLVAPGAPLIGLTTFLDGFLTGRQTGELVYFDAKANKSSTFKVPHPLSSLTCRENKVAVGTELQKPDAGVLVYEWTPQSVPKAPLREYMDAHSDDVTDVRFHPTENVLISGSTDGTVNLYDLTVADPDEAIYQSVNHNAAIHRAEFLTPNKFLALSQMETLSLYQVAHPDENVEEPQPVDFGDVREQWDCEYIADYRHGFLLIGSNNKATLRLVPFDGQPQLISAVNLEGAHGEEVCRCFCVAGGKLYTGGEDCKLKVWDLPETSAAPAAPAKSDKHKKSRKPKKSSRANPY